MKTSFSLLLVLNYTYEKIPSETTHFYTKQINGSHWCNTDFAFLETDAYVS